MIAESFEVLFHESVVKEFITNTFAHSIIIPLNVKIMNIRKSKFSMPIET